MSDNETHKEQIVDALIARAEQQALAELDKTDTPEYIEQKLAELYRRAREHGWTGWADQ